MPAAPLFVYGTLHPNRAPAELAADVKRFREVGRGSIRGELHHIGGYPAAVVRDSTTTRIPGIVFEVPDDPALWHRLDAYEDFRPQDPDASLYLRVHLPVTMDDGSEQICWVYLYNQPFSGLPQR